MKQKKVKNILISTHSNKPQQHDCIKNNPALLITDTEQGEVYCSRCGMVVIERMVERTVDSHTFSKEDYFTKTRTGAPSKISVYDLGHSSIISKNNVDVSGNGLTAKTKSHFLRMRRWDSRCKVNSKERSLIRAFTILDSLRTKLNLPENVKEHAAYLYRKASEKNIIKGTSIQSMMAASVYTSCKQFAIPRSIDEVSQISNVSRKTLSHTYRRLVKKLELDINSINIDYISKVANSVLMEEKSKRISSKILDNAKKHNVHVGKNPIGIAAASVYLSAIGTGQNITMKKLSQKNNISTVTIRKLVRLLRPFAAKYLKTIEVSS